ncbi:MAG: hypothetical protein ACYSTI_12740 [Planctomycetota bacterium]|jgi:deoxycytidylate deaminase
MESRIELAKNMARKSPSRFRLGAVLVKRRRIISTGYNQMSKTHPLQEKYHDGSHTLGTHAEVHACIGVSADDLLGAEVYVARLLKDGTQALAKPCLVCRKVLSSLGVYRVVYTTPEGYEEIEL